MSEHNACVNTDREIWRGPPDENGDTAYADSIFVTAYGSIGFNCGGMVYVMPPRAWHALAAKSQANEVSGPSSPSTPHKESGV
jgi:hypothetical protein